ncbi:MAG: hypothetical protein ACYDC3_19390, partial [Candidatus Binataceae bacterium]
PDQQESYPPDNAHKNQDQDDDSHDYFWRVGEVRHGSTGDKSLSALGRGRQARNSQAVADGGQAAAIKRRAAEKAGGHQDPKVSNGEADLSVGKVRFSLLSVVVP